MEQINYGLYFTRSFITLIDEILGDLYSRTLKREHFLQLFYTIERGRNFNNNATELSSNIRLNFGLYGGIGSRQWRFAELIRICEERNILYSTTYSKGNYCKSYGYTTDFISKIIIEEIDFQFCEISEKTYNNIYKYLKIPENPILLKHYKTINELNIDLNKAEVFAKECTGERLLRTVREISIIHNNEKLIVAQDNKTGRIFTSFNLMKKELREFCSYKGESLKSLDLKSSQPYFLASLLLKENPYNKEVKKFYELVTEGDLYEWLEEKWGGFEYRSKEETRNFVKKLFFAYLYKKNQGTNCAQMVFQDNFPEVYKIIKERKRSEELWLTLQKVESSIFIPVANQFVERGCLSVHDALYFPASLEEEVFSALIYKFSTFNLINYKLY